MRNVADLITAVRRQTENEDTSATTGISDEEFLQFLNDGQDRLQSILSQIHARIFETTTEISLVANQQAYTIPADALVNNKVVLVEYTSTGDSEDYYPLSQVQLLETKNYRVTHPSHYTIRNGSILISPVPDTGTGQIRVTYSRRLDDLDIRRATISSHTDSGTQITALTLSTTDDDVTDLDANTALCVVDRDGTVTMYNLRYDSYDDATGVVTITGSAFTYATGESITNGDFVTTGFYTTTHSTLPDITERYLVAYCAWKILERDSTNDSAGKAQEVAIMEDDLRGLFTPVPEDVEFVPVLNHNFR